MNLISLILFVVLLITLNAFFVIAEFSLLRIRENRIENLYETKPWGSDFLKKISSDLNKYIITSQIGITLSTLSIGFLALNTSNYELSLMIGNDVFTDILSFSIALIAVSFLHSVFGELVPKIISINYIEETALRIAPLLYYVSFIILPFTILYQQSANLFVRLFGVKASSRLYSRVYNEDELKLLISESQEFGEIEESEEVLLNRVFDFTETKVNEIFTPRFEIVAFEKKVPVDEIIEKARETGFSRFPIYENKLDEIIGFVHVKDILIGDYKSPDFNIMNILRNVLVIHEAMRLDLLLEKMQREKSQVAVVVDEYGSIEGFVTIEDILEEIVGPIDDEFDLDSDELIEKIGRNEFLVDGRLELDVFNQTFQSNLESEDAVTIAGYIIESLESVPEENASFQITNEKMEIIFEIRKMDGNRVENALVVINKI